MKYFYGMRLRRFSPGCQPMDGFLKREDPSTNDFYDILIYDRALSEKEIAQYSLTPMYGYIYTDNLGHECCHSFVTAEEASNDISNTLQYAYDEYCAMYPEGDVTWINRLLDVSNVSEVYVPDTGSYTRCELFEPIMRIPEYAKQHNLYSPLEIGNIYFLFMGVNMLNNADVNTSYPSGTDEHLTFIQRYDKAVAELKDLTKGMTVEEVQDYFQKETEDGNENFYGNYVFIQTAKKFPRFIKFGVRMD